MDFKKCTRCGSFYMSNGNVCPKCSTKENFEFSTFQSYVAENGLGDSIDEISGITGISVKNLNRFIEYNNQNNNNSNINSLNNMPNANLENNNGIKFLI